MSASQKEDLIIIIQSTSVASVFMSSIVLGCFICVKKLRQVYIIFTNKIEYSMIAMVSLGNLIASLTLGIAVSLPTMPTPYCVVQGFFKSFGSLISLAWTVNIAYTMRLSIMSLSPEQRKQRQNIMFTIGFIGPLILSLLPLIKDSYQVSQDPLSSTICYIVGGDQSKNSVLDDIFIFFCFQIPLISSFIFNLVCMSLVIQEYKRLLRDDKVINKISRLILYPFIIMICWAPFLVWNIMILITGEQYYKLELFCFGMSNLSGFFDGLAYGMVVIVQAWRQHQQQKLTLNETLVLSVSQQEIQEFKSILNTKMDFEQSM